MTDISIRIYAAVTSTISSALSSLKREEGQDLIEYALIGGLTAIALVAAYLFLGTYVTAMVNGIGNCIDFTAGGCTVGLTP